MANPLIAALVSLTTLAPHLIAKQLIGNDQAHLHDE
jgi:hypothetical protein